MFETFFTPNLLAILLIYLLLTGIALLIAYFVIRSAVFHALKSHSRWVEQGQP